jgi:hypothetical protein
MSFIYLRKDDPVPQNIANEAMWILQYLVHKQGTVEVPSVEEIQKSLGHTRLVKRCKRDDNGKVVKSSLTVVKK